MVLHYWPNQQGIALTKEVAHLFIITKKKVSLNLYKFTDNYLYIDILDQNIRANLFVNIVEQIENLVLDIIEIDLDIQSIKVLNYKIICDLVQKSCIKFLQNNCESYNSNKILDNNIHNYYQVILYEHQLLLEHLLTYLIFGSHQINELTYAFDNKKTPKQHIYIILDNFVIHIGNIIIQLIFNKIKSLPKIIDFMMQHKICNSIYISKRSAATFINNLLWQNFFYLYIQKPKDVYSNRYKIWFIYNKGIYTKYIYMSGLNNTQNLSSFNKILIYIIEIQDIIIPKVEKQLLTLYKLILYILINILGNTTIIVIRTIVSSFQTNYK